MPAKTRKWDDIYNNLDSLSQEDRDEIDSEVRNKDVQRNTYEGIGKPEQLKGNLNGWWTRRIDEVHRIVYCEKDGAIIIASCKGHYED